MRNNKGIFHKNIKIIKSTDFRIYFLLIKLQFIYVYVFLIMIMRGVGTLMRIKYGYSIIKDEISFTNSFRSVEIIISRHC